VQLYALHYPVPELEYVASDALLPLPLPLPSISAPSERPLLHLYVDDIVRSNMTDDLRDVLATHWTLDELSFAGTNQRAMRPIVWLARVQGDAGSLFVSPQKPKHAVCILAVCHPRAAVRAPLSRLPDEMLGLPVFYYYYADVWSSADWEPLNKKTVIAITNLVTK